MEYNERIAPHKETIISTLQDEFQNEYNKLNVQANELQSLFDIEDQKMTQQIVDKVEQDLLNEIESGDFDPQSDEDFKEYAFAVLGKAFGDKFDEEKAQEVVDGLLDKHGDDYGAAVGALQSSLG